MVSKTFAEVSTTALFRPCLLPLPSSWSPVTTYNHLNPIVCSVPWDRHHCPTWKIKKLYLSPKNKKKKKKKFWPRTTCWLGDCISSCSVLDKRDVAFGVLDASVRSLQSKVCRWAHSCSSSAFYFSVNALLRKFSPPNVLVDNELW